MITIENLQQPVGGFILQINSLRIYSGLTLLVGANGAGKSTLLELLTTVQMPRRGSILYRQRSAQEDLPLVRSQVGYVPAEIELYEEMTPYKLLVYLAELKGVFNPDRINGLLRDFRLEDYRNMRIKRLSQGVRRRIVIAQSLLAAPNFLFLDEPLNAMDSGERKLAISYLTRYAEGRTVIAAVHELNEWEGGADHILWLDKGRIRFEGGITSWACNLAYRVWEGIVTLEQFRDLPDKGIIISRETSEGMYVRLVGESAPFAGLEEANPALEDVYFVRKYIS